MNQAISGKEMVDGFVAVAKEWSMMCCAKLCTHCLDVFTVCMDPTSCPDLWPKMACGLFTYSLSVVVMQSCTVFFQLTLYVPLCCTC